MGMRIIKLLVRQLPSLRIELKKAHLKDTPGTYLTKNLKLSSYAAVVFLILTFFVIDKSDLSYLLLIPAPFIGFILVFLFLLQMPKVQITKRAREIDREVLFAGRYLLVKLGEGSPMFNALIDASKSYGICGKYFREIVDEILVGTPIEVALENAREYNASEKFKRVLSELLVTLKTGVDVMHSLQEVLSQITTEQIIELKKYAKKVNALILMYMVIGTVLPSLGMTMFIIVAGFLDLALPPVFIFVALFMLLFVQFFFLALFRSARPVVNL